MGPNQFYSSWFSGREKEKKGWENIKWNSLHLVLLIDLCKEKSISNVFVLKFLQTEDSMQEICVDT